MFSKSSTWLLILLVLLGASAAVAQDEEEPASQEEAMSEDEAGDEVATSFYAVTTVTATGSQVDTFEIATPVTVLSAEEIEYKAVDNASDLLREQPGVDVNGVGPNQTRPIIRGQRGLRVLFLENGLRMNNARRQTDFGEVPGLIDLSSVETLEVVRGPASVLYGSDAIGGVLNLITKRPGYRDGRLGGTFSLRYGSAAEQTQARLSLDGRGGRLAWRLGGSYRDGDDYEAASGTFGDVRLDDEVPVLDTGLKDDSWNGYLSYQASDRHEVFGRVNSYSAGQTGFGFVEPELIGDTSGARIRILYPFQDFDRFTFGYVGSGLESAAADTVEIQAYTQKNERQLQNDISINIGPIFPGAPDSSVDADSLNFTELETTGLRAEVVKVANDQHVLTYGLEYFEDDSFNTDSSVTTTTIRFPFPPFEQVFVGTDDVPNAPNAKNTSTGVFLQDEITPTAKLRLTLGLRFQDVETLAKPTPGWDITGLDFSDSNVVGAVSAAYAATDYLRVVGSYGTAFRAPNIIERLFNGLTPEGAGYQILNPDLVSEESENVDLGLKYRRLNAYFEVIAFRNDISDGIVQFNLGPDEIAELPPDVREEIDMAGVSFVVQQRNVERLRTEGVEVIAGYRWRDSIDFGLNYTHIDIARIDSDNPPTGAAISDKLNFHVRYRPPAGRYWLEYRLRVNGSEPSVIDENDPIPPIGPEIPSFEVHTLSGGVTLYEHGPQRHELLVVIDNLTDELYTEFSNATFFRPQPKRNVLATYRVKF